MNDIDISKLSSSNDELKNMVMACCLERAYIDKVGFKDKLEAVYTQLHKYIVKQKYTNDI